MFALPRISPSPSICASARFAGPKSRAAIGLIDRRGLDPDDDLARPGIANIDRLERDQEPVVRRGFRPKFEARKGGPLLRLDVGSFVKPETAARVA